MVDDGVMKAQRVRVDNGGKRRQFCLLSFPHFIFFLN